MWKESLGALALARPERVPDIVDQPVERLLQIGRLRREVHAHRARHQDHGADLDLAPMVAGTSASVVIGVPTVRCVFECSRNRSAGVPRCVVDERAG